MLVVACVLVLLHFHPGAGCDISQPEFKVDIPITLFSCEERSGSSNGSCILDPANVADTDFKHRGSELNNGALDLVETDKECCELCQKTPGCNTWAHIVDPDQFNKMGACWMKSAVPIRTATSAITGGIVSPIVEERVACHPMRNIGFRNQTAYNHPELLLTDNAGECCLRCQEQSSLCYGWMWMMVDRQCHLFGTQIPTSTEFLCRDCVSGYHQADRDEMKQGCPGKAGDLYEGDGRINLVPKGAFVTTTSKECCGLCDATRECRSWSWSKRTQECSLVGDIPEKQTNGDSYGGIAKRKVCQFEECEIMEGISMIGSDLFCTQFAAPYGNRSVVASQEECCAMCQEYPECTAWTFTQGDVTQSPTACWLKFSPPDEAQKPVGGGAFFSSGIVPSRLRDDQIKKFRDASKNAVEVDATAADPRIHDDEHKPGVKSKPGQQEDDGIGIDASLGGGGLHAAVVAVIVIVGVVVFVLCTIVFLISVRRHKKKEEKINEERRKALENAPAQPLMSSMADESRGLTQEERSRDSDCLESRDSSQADAESQELKKERLKQLKQRIEEMRKPSPGGGVFGKHGGAPFVLEPGIVLGDKYIIEEGVIRGGTSHVFNARQKFGNAPAVIMKFYKDKKMYATELDFFSQQLLPQYVPQVFDMFEGSVVESWGLPPFPCIVMERGDDTLGKWLEKSKATMDSMDVRNILFRICSALQSVHQHGIVHRSVSPDNIRLFRSSMSWKLVDFGWWARRGSKASIQYSLRYTPPEMLNAHAKGDQHVVAKRAVDMWALGLIFWEVLTGNPMFGDKYTDEQVMAMLIGVDPLPFEKDPHLWSRINHPAARRLVANLLHRNPNARYHIGKVLSNGFFSTGIDTVQKHNVNQHTQMVKQIAQRVEKIEEQVEKATEIMFEDFKHTIGNVLLACFSFYEISPEEFDEKNPSASELAEGFKSSTLKFTETYIEPSYNVFKRSKEEPTPLLRLDKKHLVKITLMYGSVNQMDLPIREIVYCKILPTDISNDTQDAPVFAVSEGGHLLEAVAVWDTLTHRDPTLKLIGNASLDIVIGVKMYRSDKIVEVRKTIEIRMMDPNEKFRFVKAFHRTKEWYSNLPPWAKLYIHGAVTVVKLSTKALGGI